MRPTEGREPVQASAVRASVAVNYVASGEAAAQVVGKTIRSAGGEALCEVLRRGVLAGRSRAAGKIICIFSVHEKTQWARHANYGASKGGVSVLMASMAQELGAQRIRINGIAPGDDQDRHQPRCAGHAAGRG